MTLVVSLEFMFIIPYSRCTHFISVLIFIALGKTFICINVMC